MSATLSPVVTIVDGHASTLSTDVAVFFQKRHADVLRSIENIRSRCPDSAKRNFALCFRNNELQNGKPLKMYRLTRDGFTFLAMGFTGPEADAFKWAYIEAFNRMEDALKKKVLPAPTLSPADQLKIRQAISARAKKSAVAYQTIYHALYARFQVAKYDQIRSEDLQTALDFIATCEVKLPALEDKNSITLSRDEMERIRTLVYYKKYLFRRELDLVYQLLVAVQSPEAPRFYEMMNEANMNEVEKILAHHDMAVKDLPCYRYLVGLS